jgi:predicted membrane protein
MKFSGISDRAIIGLLVVTLGIMLLLGTTNAFGPDTAVLSTYWPTLVIAWGLWGLMSFRSVLWHAAVLVIGVLFLLTNLNVWTLNIGQLWPVALVAIGLALLFSWRVRLPRQAGVLAQRSQSQLEGRADNAWKVTRIFSGGEEVVSSQEFEGSEVTVIFGGVDLDLREAEMVKGKATIDATVICGGMELTVPKDWKVNIQATPILGSTENRHRQPSPGEATGELTITGTVVCGGIEVKD